MAVLSGDGDALAVQNGLHLFGVAGGMDAAVDHLVLFQIAELRRLDLLDLGQKIAGVPQLLGGVADSGTGGSIFFIGEACALTCILFHQNGVAVCNDGCHLHRGADDPVFALFNVLQYTKNHK